MKNIKEDVIAEAVELYLAGLDMDNLPTPKAIRAEVLNAIECDFELENMDKQKSDKWKKLTELNYATIAQVINHTHNVVRIMYTEFERAGNYDLAIYQTKTGIYNTDPDAISGIIRAYSTNITIAGIKEVVQMLAQGTAYCRVNDDPDLIAVNNGIFNYKTKELLQFSPDLVFTSKSKVDYNPLAINPVIHNLEDGTDWDVETWISDLSDDPGVVELLWQVIGSIIRPNVAWDKVVCFYSEQGNNGKGTLCALMRNLCGAGTHANIPFSNFGKENNFTLEELTQVSAIIVDENSTTDFTKAAASLKAVITGDYLQINRKYLKVLTFRFRGVMVQCVNALPKFGDKSDSLYRRFLLVPFNKCFTGAEKKYIKEDYLARKEVLEYVLYKTLQSNCYSYSIPQVCEDLLEVYKIHNDPIRQFLDDVLTELAWDVVPNKFLYDLYKSWHNSNNPSGVFVAKHGFIRQVKQILRDNPLWVIVDKPTPTRSGMSAPEPLILQYNLKDWMNKKYKGDDEQLLCTTTAPSSYTGLRKK